MTEIDSVRFLMGAQIRAGRALLGWRREDLAKAARLHPNAVSYWERHERLPRSEPIACQRIRAAFFTHGVVGVNKPAPGVCRFRDPVAGPASSPLSTSDNGSPVNTVPEPIAGVPVATVSGAQSSGNAAAPPVCSTL